MAIPKHLIRVGDTYYANVRVPSDIAESYGKENVRRSLRTKDEKEAGRRVHAKVAEIERDFVEYQAKVKAQEVAIAAPKPAPTPQSFADLARQYGREIAEGALTIRADLYEAAVADKKEFWRGASKHFSAPDEFTYFDKLKADGDLDRVVGYIVRKTTGDRISDLKRMIDTGDMGELLALAEERSPGLDRKAQVYLAKNLAGAEIAALQSALSGDLEGYLHTAEAAPVSALNSGSTAPTLLPVSLDSLFDKWKAETKPSASTLSTWGGIVKALRAALWLRSQSISP